MSGPPQFPPHHRSRSSQPPPSPQASSSYDSSATRIAPTPIAPTSSPLDPTAPDPPTIASRSEPPARSPTTAAALGGRLVSRRWGRELQPCLPRSQPPGGPRRPADGRRSVAPRIPSEQHPCRAPPANQSTVQRDCRIRRNHENHDQHAAAGATTATAPTAMATQASRFVMRFSLAHRRKTGCLSVLARGVVLLQAADNVLAGPR